MIIMVSPLQLQRISFILRHRSSRLCIQSSRQHAVVRVASLGTLPLHLVAEKKRRRNYLPSLNHEKPRLSGFLQQKYWLYSSGSSTTIKSVSPVEENLLQFLERGHFHKIADELQDFFENSNDKISESTFNSLVSRTAGRKNKKAATTAESFLQWMIKFHEQERLDGPLTIALFGRVLSALERFPDKRAAKIADSLLQQMKDLYRNKAILVPPDGIAFCTVFRIHGKAKNLNRMQEVFDDMVIDFLAGNESAKPSLKSWTVLLNLYGESGDRNAWIPAEKNFLRLKDLMEKGSITERPDAILYGTLLKVFARCGKADEAEFWLEKMYEDYQSGNLAAKPNLTCYNTVMLAWAKQCTSDSAKRCEDILHHQKEIGKQGLLEVSPNRTSYTIAIDAYCDLGLAEDADRILSILFQEVQDGCVDVTDQRILISTNVMETWIEADAEVAGERNEAILDRLEHIHKLQLCPATKTEAYSFVWQAYESAGKLEKMNIAFKRHLEAYSAGNDAALVEAPHFVRVIKAFAESGRPNAWENIYDCFEWWIDLVKMPTRRDKWNNSVFGMMHKACAKLGRENEAIHLFKQMEEMFSSGLLSLPADDRFFGIAINHWAEGGNSGMAETIFNIQLESYKGGNQHAKPTEASFGTLLKAYCNESNDGIDICEKVDAALKQLEDLGLHANAKIVKSALRCWSKHPIHPRAETRCKELRGRIDELDAASREKLGR